MLGTETLQEALEDSLRIIQTEMNSFADQILRLELAGVHVDYDELENLQRQYERVEQKLKKFRRASGENQARLREEIEEDLYELQTRFREINNTLSILT